MYVDVKSVDYLLSCCALCPRTFMQYDKFNNMNCTPIFLRTGVNVSLDCIKWEYSVFLHGGKYSVRHVSRALYIILYINFLLDYFETEDLLSNLLYYISIRYNDRLQGFVRKLLSDIPFIVTNTAISSFVLFEIKKFTNLVCYDDYKKNQRHTWSFILKLLFL